MNEESHVEYVVEKILDKRTRRDRIEYLVDWRGQGIHERSWEPLSHLTNAMALVDEYESEIAAGKRRSKRKRY